MNKQKIIIGLAVLVLALAVYFFSHDRTTHQHGSTTEQAGVSVRPHSTSGVVSVDIKFVNGRLHLLLGKLDQDQDQASLWYQSSPDHGQTWSKLVNITATMDITAKFHRGNDARLAVQGNNIVAVWMSKKEGAPHNAGPMMSVRSADGGQSWQQAGMPADWDGAHGFFAMDSNEKQISLVWLDSRQQLGKGSQGMRYTHSQNGGITWLANKTLDQQTCACCWNTARFDGEGQLYVLYRDKQPSDMALGQVDQHGKWQRLSSVGDFNWDFEGCPHIGGGLAFDESGQFHATVATGHEQYLGVYYLNSVDQGRSWSAKIQLGDSSAVHSDIAVLDNGIVLATWDQISESGFEVVYALSQDGGETWGEQIAISTKGIRSSHPRVIAMNKEFLLLWTESTVGGAHSLQTKLIINGDEIDN
ncbi:MAG: hypothetical protein COB23_06095 [Methylophaga sp.]|nr:MAG: hypothetical protein COB23_06095 [Methylophaga sp.]